MVTFDEELANAIKDARNDDDSSVEEVFEWYSMLICEALARVDEDAEPFIEEIEERWNRY